MNKKVSIIGAGVSGMGLMRLAKKNGYDIFISESRNCIDSVIIDEIKNNGVGYEVGGNTSKVLDADFVILSSGVSPNSNIIKKIRESGVRCIGELDFICQFLNKKIIAVTGSNGKSTTVKLISHILNKNGCSCAAAGNIGVSLADFVESNFEYLSVELSSFQLYWSNDFKSDVSIITNIEPDHIDWHGTFENYKESKMKILNKKSSEAFSIMKMGDYKKYCNNFKNIIKLTWNEVDDPWAIYMSTDECFFNSLLSKEKLFNYEDIHLIGKHNLENVAMAMVASRLVYNNLNNMDVKDFLPLGHRCEKVAVINGVTYIDDSKGTNVAATRTAIEAIQGKKIIILGGQGKGEDYSPLALSVAAHAEWAVLIGEESTKIATALKNLGFEKIYISRNMEDAVLFSYKVARQGMVVLLSPSCTSWDMYRNYKERGDHFKNIVKNIECNFSAIIKK